jgi:hypothetical protein
MADIIINQVFGKHVFNWGRSNSVSHSEARNNYLVALKEADKGNIKPLLEFAKA